ncbi:class I SAM-dependent methyltransferase [Streptomyces sp. LE64]|uniref:class I SAM-dependent methyltransferase n=1 Tax=Streptomyces sp. LE64 TaxID=3448653 RepID=UPI0040411611
MRPRTPAAEDPDDPKDLVRRGYDALSQRYEEAFDSDTKYQDWLADLHGRLPTGSRVLDLGCGNGVPVARDLTAAGHRVLGVDLSGVQVRRARARVPGAEFRREDITALDFPEGSFDAVLALYSLIHLPLGEQLPLLRRVVRWLRPGGSFLVTVGRDALTGTDEDWLGSGVAMWWSHPDAATSREWLRTAGFEVREERFVPEGDGGHVLFVAARPLG